MIGTEVWALEVNFGVADTIDIPENMDRPLKMFRSEVSDANEGGQPTVVWEKRVEQSLREWMDGDVA